MAYENNRTNSEEEREILNIVESHINDSLGFIASETSK